MCCCTFIEFLFRMLYHCEQKHAWNDAEGEEYSYCEDLTHLINMSKRVFI